MSSLGSDQFMHALRGLLRPLVRTFIARGISAPAFYRLLKSVYVEVAKEDFQIDGKITDSRISLLTGVHRRDVKDILSNPDTVWEAARSKTALVATVLGQWIARPEYQTDAGAPVALPKGGANGISFESLVRLVNTDIRPRTVLDELLRQDLVVEGADGLLRLADPAVLGPGSEDHKLVFFAANLGDHIAAASENLLADDPPFYERAVFHNGLPPEAIDEIEKQARDQAQNMLETLNKKSTRLRNETGVQDKPTQRFRLGVYFYRETSQADVGKSGNESGDDDIT